MSRKMLFLLIFIFFLVENGHVNAQTAIFENSEKIEEARNFMIELYSKKIQDHILMIFTILGGWFTFTKVDKSKAEKIDRIYSAILFTFVIYLLLYTTGRLIFWSQFNGILLTVEPMPSNKVPEGSMDNLKWGFHKAISRRINGKRPFDNLTDYPRYFNIRIAYRMSGSRLIGVRFLYLPLLSIILSKLFYHRYGLIKFFWRIKEEPERERGIL